MTRLSEFLAWHGRRLPRMVGWLGIAGTGLVLAVLMFNYWVLVPLRASVTDMRDETEHLRQRIATRHMVDSKQEPGDQLAEFYRFFPGDDVMTEVMRRIYAAAARQNLVLEHGEYQLIPTREAKLTRYSLTLPIKGPYTKLRRFIAEVLKENPSLALDGVSFSRQAVMEIGVNAQVRMTLFLKSE